MNNNNALLIIDMQQEDGFVLENLDRVVAHTAALLPGREAGGRHTPQLWERACSRWTPTITRAI